MENKTSKGELITKWKEAFKSDKFLEKHRNRCQKFADSHRDILDTDNNVMIRIIDGTPNAIICDMTQRDVVSPRQFDANSVFNITKEEFQELFDLYESFPINNNN